MVKKKPRTATNEDCNWQIQPPIDTCMGQEIGDGEDAQAPPYGSYFSFFDQILYSLHGLHLRLQFFLERSKTPKLETNQTKLPVRKFDPNLAFSISEGRRLENPSYWG
jgi:hypothetical protein